MKWGMKERDKENEETEKLVNSEEFNQMIEENRNNQDSEDIEFWLFRIRNEQTLMESYHKRLLLN